MNTDNYPPGAANDPNAPYNQCEPDPVEIDVTASVTLSRSAQIEVNDYTIEDTRDTEYEDGELVTTGGYEYDFSDCDLKSAFKEQQYTIPELLERLKAYLEEDIANSPEDSGNACKLRGMLEACEAWTVDEEEVVKD